MPTSYRVAFIAGAARSGTTIMNRVLGAHQDAVHLAEPYYLWFYHLGALDDDYIPPDSVGPKEIEFIRRQFDAVARRTGKRLIIDKLPEHSFNLPVLHKVFPDALFLHMLRDGRDATLSIKKEWAERLRMVEGKDYGAFAKRALTKLGRQPLWRLRALYAWYELKNNFSLRPSRYLNKGKWKGQAAYGLRFRGWEKMLAEGPLTRFQAHQWLAPVEQIRQDFPSLPAGNVMEMRYEDLVGDDYDDAVRRAIEFVGLPDSDAFRAAVPQLQLGNTAKWPNELSAPEIRELGAVVADKLIELGYESDAGWLRKYDTAA